jgi:hypothetical protein
MNVFTNLLFPDIGRPAEAHAFDEEDGRYAKGFGNRVASERFFAPLGHTRAEAAEARDLPVAAIGCCA